eukprot:663164_1
MARLFSRWRCTPAVERELRVAFRSKQLAERRVLMRGFVTGEVPENRPEATTSKTTKSRSKKSQPTSEEYDPKAPSKRTVRVKRKRDNNHGNVEKRPRVEINDSESIQRSSKTHKRRNKSKKR